MAKRNLLTDLYSHSLALLTDLYQITMAYGYWKTGQTGTDAVFHMHFRKNPFGGGYAVAAGLETVIHYLERLRFTGDDLAYLATLEGNDGNRLLPDDFLEYLRELRFTCDVDAVPEGTVAYPHEPLVRVKGPLIQCQLIETPLLNFLNFQTLIATKASRICTAAKGEPVLEFGLRRAQGIDGSLAASRAAYLGGCAATSNVLASKIHGIPVRGTHAHSWVMMHDSEPEAFRAYAQVMPNNCVFLVDTYNTLEGVRRAAEIGKELAKEGHRMIGIRLDSGDLAYLSIEARKILDEAGLKEAVIVASNDLDEQIITSLKTQGATINVWGVGTKLATGYDQPALGGVYKLAAVRKPGGPWQYKVKISEQASKTSNPGIPQVRRYEKNGEFIGDAIYDESHPPENDCTIVDPADATRRKTIPAGTKYSDLLVPVFREGKAVYDLPALDEIRNRTLKQLSLFNPGIKRFLNPHEYPVGLEESLHEKKIRLILEARQSGARVRTV